MTGSNSRIGEAVMRRFAGCGAVVKTDRAAPEPLPGCVYLPVEVTSDEGVREGLFRVKLLGRPVVSGGRSSVLRGDRDSDARDRILERRVGCARDGRSL